MLKNMFMRFSNTCETSEGHPDEELRTHYYRTNKDGLFTTLEKQLASRPGCKIVESSKERGEIACELTAPFPCFLIATVVTVRPFETAADFLLSTERSPLLGNYSAMKKEIISIYKAIGSSHPFIGKGKNS